ncbi:MAG: autotransporter outer membrane beta-barrel domain-containing protein [Desulfobacterales bacterium]
MKVFLKSFLLLIFCLLVSVNILWAKETTSQAKALVNPYSFKVGPDMRYINYEEDALDMEIDGFMYGVSGEINYHGISEGKAPLMASLSVEFLVGEMDYDGGTWAGDPAKADTDDWIFHARELLGYDFFVNGNHLITPFVGIAYRYWNDEIDGIGGYEREIQYWYSPIGVQTLSRLSDQWTLGLSAEYNLFWSGLVKSHLSDVSPVVNDPSVSQDFGDGYGLRFSADFIRKFSDRHSMVIEPYITYWDIDDSDFATLREQGVPVGWVYEPANETLSYGLRVSFGF